MDLLSPPFQVGFRNFCSDLVLRQIDDIFQGAGFRRGTLENPPSGQRRARTLEYLTGTDYEDEADVGKVLRAVEIALFSPSVLDEQMKERLRAICDEEGLRIEGKKVLLGGASGHGIKNLIFASIGPKPEIVLIDATTNDIQITKNAANCLVYDRPISGSLLWSELVDWWIENGATTDDVVRAGRELRQRLEQSLDSEPEKMLMRRYFVSAASLGDRLPALIPQVYLHYDPYTARERGGTGPLARQRMDFLLLMQGGHRVVLEVDGKQHYSEGDRSSPRLYAEMMAEDRRLRLKGYEVYRFGGYEFVVQARAEAMLDAFFTDLFSRCGYQQ